MPMTQTSPSISTQSREYQVSSRRKGRISISESNVWDDSSVLSSLSPGNECVMQAPAWLLSMSQFCPRLRQSRSEHAMVKG